MDIQSCSVTRPTACSRTSRRASPRTSSTLPGPDFLDRVVADTDRKPQVLRNLAVAVRPRPARRHRLRLDPARSTRASSTRPARSFAPNPMYFDPENIVELAIEGGCNAVATTFGVLGAVSRRYAHRIPFIVKFNHNELLTYPNKFDQIMFGIVEQAFDMGAAGVGATIYFGSDEATRQIQEVRAGVRAGARARHVHRAVVLPAQQRVQAGRRRLPRRRRPHRPGQPHRRHDPGRHHQAEAADEQRRLHRAQGLRQDQRRRSTTS